MEVHGSRSEIIAKMRQTRTEKLKAKLAQEGIAGLDIEHTYPEVKSFHVTEQHGNPDRFDHTSEERGYPEQESYDYRSENVSRKRDERTPPKYDSYVQPKPQVDEEARFYSISPSANLSSPQLKFYQNAINTVKRKQMTDALKTQEIKKQANEKKINEKSEQLLFDKMRYKLRESIYEVCSTEASPFTFEKLGRVLTLLNFIHFISYQEDCQPSFDSDINDGIDQLRRLEEMTFHDQLWAHMGFDGETVQKAISSDQAEVFLAALFDPRTMNYKEHLNFIDNVLTQNSFSIASEPTQIELDGETVVLCDLGSLVKMYRKLAKNNLYYSKTGYLKGDKADEIRQKIEKENPFTPQINNYSRALSQVHDEKLKKSFISDGLDKTNGRVEQLYFKNTIKEETLERKRQMRAKEQQQECTFQPNLSKTNKYNSEYVNRTSKNSNAVVDRLYEDLSTKYEMLEDVKHQRQIRKTQEEMSQCTFYPQVNDLGKKDLENLHDSYPMPRSYKDAVNRLKRAKEMRQEKKRKLETIPDGRNLEKFRRMAPNPPRCYRGNSIMKFQINISDKDTTTLELYEQDLDNIDGKLKGFIMRNKLGEEQAADLRSVIEKYIIELRKQQQFNED